MFQHLRELRNSAPGQRFQELYQRRQATRNSLLRRQASLALAAIVLIAGIFMLALPGPGWLTILLGAGLLARESILAARGLDWLELKTRQLLTRISSKRV